jgi:hypothetical protein
MLNNQQENQHGHLGEEEISVNQKHEEWTEK